MLVYQRVSELRTTNTWMILDAPPRNRIRDSQALKKNLEPSSLSLFSWLPSGYLTQPWKMTHLQMVYLLNMVIFHGYVKQPDGTILGIPQSTQILVGALEHFGTMEFGLTFHSVGNVILPTVTHSIIFQRGRAQPPTRTSWIIVKSLDIVIICNYPIVTLGQWDIVIQ